MVSPFEDAMLNEADFDLGISATAFHWLKEEPALQKVAQLLRPGGWWAMVWNVFGDPNRSDPFHEAERIDAFDVVEHQAAPWSLVLDADQTVALYATYSNINIRPDRKTVLAELDRIARIEFNGSVTRNMITGLYIARRRF